MISNSFQFIARNSELATTNWFEPYIQQLASRSAIPTTIQSVGHNLTRGELAEIIYRLKTGKTDQSSLTYAQVTQPLDYAQIPVVFVYLDEPLDPEIQQQYIGNRDDPNTLMYFETWVAREADRYGVNFRRELVIYPEQIKVPKEYAVPFGSEKAGMISDRADFQIWITGACDLQKYDTIAVILYDSTGDRPFEDFAVPDYSNNQKSYTYTHIRRSLIEFNNLFSYYPPTPVASNQDDSSRSMVVETFTHEFFHTIWALDKYGTSMERACTADENGGEYSGYDLFCHRIASYDSDGELIGYETPAFIDLEITEPTAREIGWLDGNYIIEQCSAKYPEIQGFALVKQTDDITVFRVILSGCASQMQNEYDITLANPANNLSSRGDIFRFSKSSPVDYAYKNSTNTYQISVCDKSNKDLRPQVLRPELCGNIVEFNPQDFTWHELSKEP